MLPAFGYAIAILVLSAGRPPGAGAPDVRPREGVARAAPLVGVVSASQVLDLIPLIEGRIASVKTRLGTRVEAGQVVAVLEAKPLQLELSIRQAVVKAAEAERSRALLRLKHAQRKFEREQRIRSFTSLEEVEAAENDLELAKVDVELTQAKLAEAKAQQAVATEYLEQTHIRAPFAGLVSEQYLQSGMLANRTTPLLRLVREEPRLRFAVPESLATRVRPGVEVLVRLESTASPVTGIVDRVSPELDPVSRHLRAEARLTIPEGLRGRIPIGLVVDVELRPPVEQGAVGPD